jgi:hypothetical protein
VRPELLVEIEAMAVKPADGGRVAGARRARRAKPAARRKAKASRRR